MKQTQRSWIITGVSSGFGRHLSEQLLARGDRVVGTVRQSDAAADLVKSHPGLFRAEILDVTDTVAIREVVDRTFASLGRVDVVVSNAGYGLFGAAEEYTDEQIRHIIDTNLIGSIELIRAALPLLRAQGGGRIIQMSSYGGQVAGPGTSMYHATKWGIEGFAEAVSAELAPFNIGVTLVEPGGARTEFRFGSAQIAPPIADYDGTPAHTFRSLLDPARKEHGDPVKVANAIIASVDQEPAPLRLLLGSDAYQRTHQVLSDRLAALEAQKAMAATTDVTGED
jgi:NAD(P)-dependent dehydrogenase (short-subunit alcohol dehydrogenase family)